MRENNVFKIELPKVETRLNAALLRNKDRTVDRLIEIDESLKQAMNGARVKFFNGHIDLNTRRIILEEEAPYQPW